MDSGEFRVTPVRDSGPNKTVGLEGSSAETGLSLVVEWWNQRPFRTSFFGNLVNRNQDPNGTIANDLMSVLIDNTEYLVS